MAIDVNFLGRLIADPIEKQNPNTGEYYAEFTQITNVLIQGTDGNRKTIFVRVIARQNDATNILKYCKKGTQIKTTGVISDLSAYNKKDTGEPVPSLTVKLLRFEWPDNKKER